MMTNSTQITEQFEDKKIKTVERAYFYFFTVNIIDGIIGRSWTTYELRQEFNTLFYALGLFLILMGILVITKFFVTKIKVKKHIYVLIGVIYTIIMHSIFLDKAFVTLHGIILVLYIIPSIMNKLKYFFYYSIIPVVILMYYYFNPPNHAIEIGRSFYFNTLLTFVMLTYLLYKIVNQNKWYENQLKESVLTTESQSIELGVTNKKLSTILNVTHEAFIEVNTQNFKIKFNRMAREIFPFGKKDVSLKIIMNLLNEYDRGILRKSFYDIKNDIDIQNKTEVSYNNGKSKNYYSLAMTKYIENDIAHVLIAGKDITLEKEREQSLYKAAYVDRLTGLMSKQALYKQLDVRIKQNKNNFAMYILDLKGMKNINAMFGFKIGDEVIKSVASNLKKILEGNYLLARTGGDEFALIIDDVTNPRKLNNLIAERLDRYIDDDMNFRISYKVGVAYMKDAKDSMELYENAEMAMYMAKENIIEDVTIYKKEYRSEAEKSIKLSHELENALINKEIYLNFQPKVCSKTGKIVSYEALVRWKSSKLGFVSPLDFIQIAEQTGYIIVLGKFIIEESCKFAKRAILKDPDIIVSVNISSVQLRKYSFELDLLEIIDSYEVPRHNIGIEITETAVISNFKRVKKILNNVRKSGITVLLDDFGTGYSSLSHLNILPIDVLKIDKSFIDNIETDVKQKKLIKHIIAIAKSMGLKIVAEGVEVEEQFEILKNYECEIIQGYYFYRPLNDEEALELI